MRRTSRTSSRYHLYVAALWLTSSTTAASQPAPAAPTATPLDPSDVNPATAAVPSPPNASTSESQAAAPSALGPTEADRLALRMARAQFDQGSAAYAAFQYQEAVRWWSTAYALLRDKPALEHSRMILAFDLGQAQIGAYQVDKRHERLIAAEELLREYLSGMGRDEALPGPAEQADIARAQGLLAHIDELRSGQVPAPLPERLAPLPSAGPNVEFAPRSGTPGIGMISAGASLLGLSAITGGLAGFAFGQVRESGDAFLDAQDEPTRERASFDGTRASQGFFASIALTVVSSTVGATLLTVGLVKRRRHRRDNVNLSWNGSSLLLAGTF